MRQGLQTGDKAGGRVREGSAHVGLVLGRNGGQGVLHADVRSDDRQGEPVHRGAEDPADIQWQRERKDQQRRAAHHEEPGPARGAVPALHHEHPFEEVAGQHESLCARLPRRVDFPVAETTALTAARENAAVRRQHTASRHF